MSVFEKIINNYQRLVNRKSIAVIQDDDLENLLNSLGVLDQLKLGSIPCTHCDSPVNMQNLSGCKKLGSQLLVFCDKPQCILALSTSIIDSGTIIG